MSNRWGDSSITWYTPGQGNRRMEGGFETSSGAPMYTREAFLRGEAPYVTGATSSRPNFQTRFIVDPVTGRVLPVKATDYGHGVKVLDVATETGGWGRNAPPTQFADTSIEPGPLGEPTPQDWASVTPDTWAEPTPANQYPFSGETPYTADYPGFNVPPNENMYPTPVMPYNVPPTESYDYPTPIISATNPAPYGPSDYPTPVENPIYNPAPYDSTGYPSPIDFSNPAPTESTDYPTQIDFNNPAPNEDIGYPTPVDLSNPAPSEDMLPTPVDTYLPPTGGEVPIGGGAHVPVPPSNAPMYVDTTGVPVSPLSARPGDINYGGLGQPMGYFNSPSYYTGGNIPFGAYGVGGQGGSFFAGSGIPVVMGGGNLGPLFGGGGGLSILSLGSGGGRTGQGIYGMMLGSGSGAGGSNKVAPNLWG